MQDFKWDVTKSRRVLIDFLKEEGIQYLDLLPAFKEYAGRTGEYLHYQYDGLLMKRTLNYFLPYPI